MTDEMMSLRALLEKSSDAELLREMVGFAAQRLMELEVESLTGAGHNENPLERLNGESKPPTEVVAIFPTEAAITRLVGAILLEQNDEWAVQRARYMTPETIAALSDDPVVGLPAMVI